MKLKMPRSSSSSTSTSTSGSQSSGGPLLAPTPHHPHPPPPPSNHASYDMTSQLYLCRLKKHHRSHRSPPPPSHHHRHAFASSHHHHQSRTPPPPHHLPMLRVKPPKPPKKMHKLHHKLMKRWKKHVIHQILAQGGYLLGAYGEQQDHPPRRCLHNQLTSMGEMEKGRHCCLPHAPPPRKRVMGVGRHNREHHHHRPPPPPCGRQKSGAHDCCHARMRPCLMWSEIVGVPEPVPAVEEPPQLALAEPETPANAPAIKERAPSTSATPFAT